VKTNLKC